MSSVVVVGSGPNGLVAAVLLADCGFDVEVIEAAALPGGGLHTSELTLPGFRHDVCASVYPLALASPVLRGMGLEREGLRWAHSPVALAHPLDGAAAGLLHRSLSRTAAELGEDGARWRTLVGSAAAAGDTLVDALMSPLQFPRRGHRDLLRYGTAGVLPAAWLAPAALRGEPARAMFAGLAAHSALHLGAPLTSGYGVLLAALAHRVGWPVVVGGSDQLAAALVARLRSRGGRITLGRKVIDVRELSYADAVVLDVGPRQLLELAGPLLPASYARGLRRFRSGPGVFKVDWALDGPVPWRDSRVATAATVHLGGTLGQVVAAERAVAQGRHVDRPFVLFGQPTVADPSRAPRGGHIAWAYCHVPNSSTRDMTAAIEAQVERFAPGFAERVIGRHVMGPAQLQAHNANLIGGDIAGGSADWRQFLFRPMPAREPWVVPIRNTYLCSASTPPGGGVHGMGGFHAAGALLRRMGGPTSSATPWGSGSRT